MIGTALDDSATFASNNFGEAQFFKSKSDLHYFCSEYFSSICENPSAFGEFGVCKGDSLNRFASLLPEWIQIYGFDSFEGLPEEWTGFGMRRGDFSLGDVNLKFIRDVNL